MQNRIAEVEKYAARSPGEIGIVLRDRQDGAVWRNRAAGTEIPSASTVKLAMVVDLLLRNHSGQITLSGDDWGQIDQMLSSSSDTAADQLCSEYFDSSSADRVVTFGTPAASFTADPPYWGYVDCTADYLDGVIGYVPTSCHRVCGTSLSAGSGASRPTSGSASGEQAGAGHRAEPGNKDGWEDDSGVWIVDSVGFAGPGARYTLSMMDNLEGNGTSTMAPTP